LWATGLFLAVSSDFFLGDLAGVPEGFAAENGSPGSGTGRNASETPWYATVSEPITHVGQDGFGFAFRTLDQADLGLKASWD